MTIWLDAQLPPQLADWIKTEIATDAVAVRDLGLRNATDKAIFAAACTANAVLMSKATLSRWFCATARRQN